MPVFTASTTVAEATTTTDVTMTPDVSGDNVALLVGVGEFVDAPKTITDITIGGASLTQLETVSATSNVSGELWYIVGPTVGADLHIYVETAAAGMTAIALTITDVDQNDPISASTNYNANVSSDFTYGLTSAVKELGVDIVVSMNDDGNAPGDYATTQSGQTSMDSNNWAGASSAGSIEASWLAGAASLTFGWQAVGGTPISAGTMAVSLKPAAPIRSRSIKYFMDINDPAGRIFDNIGRVVPPWQIAPNNWIRVTGLFSPTSKKYASFAQDPELAYIEEVQFSMGRGLRMKTNRGELADVMLARAAGGKTL
jgi:hypothetical protein